MILGVIFSCNPEEIAPSAQNDYLTTSSDGSIVLGEKLDNPYSLVNMKQAAKNLGKTNGREDGEIEIAPTHLYVKFKPKSYEELELLHTSDTTLILFSYPLDYKIKENGSYYHDPEVPKDKPTYQYTSVPIDYDFPAPVDYKILEEVYIPTLDENNNGRTEDEAMALEAEAFRITGNLPESTTGGSKANNGRTEGWLTWRPSGRLRVWDDIIGSYTTSTQVFSHWEYYDCGGIEQLQTQQKGISSDLPSEQLLIEPIEECRRAIYTTVYETHSGSYIPLEGIKVRMHTFVKIGWGTTNAAGNYSSNLTFAAFPSAVPVQYSFVWETTKYIIFDNLAPAFHNGPLKSSSWNYDFGSGKSLGIATIHRAGYRYHWKDIGGLKRPGVISRLQITYLHTDGTGVNWGHYWQQFATGIAVPNIKIWGLNGSNRKLTNNIFGTTIHEFGHASHIVLMTGLLDYYAVHKNIYESWADAVQWHITNIDYSYHGVVNYHDTSNDWFNVEGTWYAREHKQSWEAGDSDYTPVFIDIVDNYNQAIIRVKIGILPNDDVTGYSIGGIESGFLGQVYNFGSLRTQMQSHRPSGVTTTQVNTYMDYYN